MRKYISHIIPNGEIVQISTKPHLIKRGHTWFCLFPHRPNSRAGSGPTITEAYYSLVREKGGTK